MTQASRYERLPGAGISLSVLRRAADAGSPAPTRALVLLHGWPGTHRDWRAVFDLLCGDPRFDHVELVLPDLRGFGDSDHPEVLTGAQAPYVNYLPAAHVADLGRLVEHLQAQELLVAGYDLGANIAQALARAEPAQVKGVLLCDPVHPAARAQAARMNLSAELWYQQLHQLEWAPDLLAQNRLAVETYLRHFYTHWWGEGAVDEAHFQAIVDVYARPGAFSASIAWYRARVGGQAAASAAPATRLAQPAQVLWGEADPITPVIFADSLHESFEDSELERLPGVGHFAPLEAPAQVAAAFGRLADRVGWPAGG